LLEIAQNEFFKLANTYPSSAIEVMLIIEGMWFMLGRWQQAKDAPMRNRAPTLRRREAEESYAMTVILNLLEELPDADLYRLCEAIDLELQFRAAEISIVFDSARRRAAEREQCYRRCNGAAALPVRVVGMIRRRAAA
jgi:hypothetical protein